MKEMKHRYHFNRLIDLFEQKKRALGTFTLSHSVTTAFFLNESGADFVVIDMEHDPYDIKTLQMFLLGLVDKADVLRKGNLQPEMTPIVRIPQYGFDRLGFVIKQVLDTGVFGILVPHVTKREDAEHIVNAAQYPSRKEEGESKRGGVRGASPHNCARYWGVDMDEYYRHAGLWPRDPSGDILIMVVIETQEAVHRIEEIITVPGIGGAFIGLYDLSFSLGIPGEMSHPELEENVEKVLSACMRQGVPCGLPVSALNMETRLEQGFQFVTTVIDRGRFAEDAFTCANIFNRKYR